MEMWAKAQEDVVRQLGQALQGDIDEEQVVQAVERAVQHFQHCYEAEETTWQRTSALLSSPLVSPLERAFMWLGGLRPSMAFQLLYALIGHHVEADVQELLELTGAAAVEGRPASLAALSASQLAELSDLQTCTIKEEDRVEQEIAMLQQSVADHRPLSVLSFSSSSSSPAEDDDISRSNSSMNSAISSKLASLQEICKQGHSLRFSTFKRVLELLHSPLQKAQYLVAAAKLQVALRNLGHDRPSPSMARHP